MPCFAILYHITCLYIYIYIYHAASSAGVFKSTGCPERPFTVLDYIIIYSTILFTKLYCMAGDYYTILYHIMPSHIPYYTAVYKTILYGLGLLYYTIFYPATYHTTLYYTKLSFMAGGSIGLYELFVESSSPGSSCKARSLPRPLGMSPSVSVGCAVFLSLFCLCRRSLLIIAINVSVVSYSHVYSYS